MNVFCLETGQIAPELSVFKYLIRQRSFVDRNNMISAFMPVMVKTSNS